MRKTGFVTLGISLGGAALLGLIWLIGLVAHIGGSLIHLSLVLAMLLGFFGGIAGMILLLVGNEK